MPKRLPAPRAIDQGGLIKVLRNTDQAGNPNNHKEGDPGPIVYNNESYRRQQAIGQPEYIPPIDKRSGQDTGQSVGVQEQFPHQGDDHRGEKCRGKIERLKEFSTPKWA